MVADELAVGLGGAIGAVLSFVIPSEIERREGGELGVLGVEFFKTFELGVHRITRGGVDLIELAHEVANER